MSDETKPQDTQEQPTQDVKPDGELADEQLDDVNGGVLIALNQPTLTVQPAPIAPTPPSISPLQISGIKGEKR
jgi:hypothetical protein